MPARRFVSACVALFTIAVVWNGLVHGFLLRELDAAVAHLRRPAADGLLWLSLPLTAGVVCLFALGYVRTVRTGSVREGLAYGAAFAVLAGLLVDLDQYLLYPIPGRVALAWFASGLVEFVLYGAVASRLLRPAAKGK